MGGGYTLSTTILHYNFWKRRGSFLGLSECRGFLEVLYHTKYTNRLVNHKTAKWSSEFCTYFDSWGGQLLESVCAKKAC